MSDLTNQTDTLFLKWNTNHTPGCLLAIIQDGDILYQQGYGLADLENTIPISPESVFYIASTSKQFTAASILLLAHKGRLSLDDDICLHIREMPLYNTAITIRHLIHHTSGLRDSLTLLDLAGINVTEAIYNNADLLKLVARQENLNFPPGEQYKYCNAGYLLLAEIVARVSGKTLRQFAHDNIFAPLNMHHTHFDDHHREHIPNRVMSYHPHDNGYKAYPKNFDIVGSGGLLTTSGDLALWDQNFYIPKIGDTNFINTLYTPGSLNSGESLTYAFGLQVGDYKGLRVIHHAGGMLGFRTNLYRFPNQNFSVICLSNSADIDASQICCRVADLYLADQFRLDSFTGNYHSTELDVIYTLENQNGDLIITSPATFDEPLRSQGNDKFQSGNKTIQFLRNHQNTIIGFDIKTDRVFNVHFVKT
jgi:CubicO group peptidase (beta-lactamase class C family)